MTDFDAPLGRNTTLGAPDPDSAPDPNYLPDQVSESAARTLPSTRAGGQDDMSSD